VVFIQVLVIVKIQVKKKFSSWNRKFLFIWTLKSIVNVVFQNLFSIHTCIYFWVGLYAHQQIAFSLYVIHITCWHNIYTYISTFIKIYTLF
jgi:hypothetical protein